MQVGIASAIGEQPVKGLVNPAAGARMSVAESLTNLMFAPISDLKVTEINIVQPSSTLPLTYAETYF